ncbi:MAG: WYL domain-containing protein [Austwickia sp.]|nr:WYL domain-containing protein [Austwickia sp.]MCO5310799.1 WYL domain-containing protein [Austwickia sp.]
MAETTQRVLRLLSLLESRAVWGGPELAARLDVTERTVRRDVERLRDLGYPVQAERGAGGGYRLGAGRRLPPLLLDDEEAVAVAVSLRLAATGSVAALAEPAMRTMTKLDQVLPPRLRGEVAAVAEATVALPGLAAPVDAETLMTLARAARDRVRVRFGYAAREGTPTDRDVEPYRLVTTGRRWYLLAFDPDRDDWRTFRLDRMQRVGASTFRFTARPAPDAATFVRDAVTTAPYAHVVTVRYDVPAAAVRDRIPGTVGQVRELSGAPDGFGTEVVVGADSFDGLAWHLITVAVDLGARLRVVGPAEFAAVVAAYPARLAGRLDAAATPGA